MCSTFDLRISFFQTSDYAGALCTCGRSTTHKLSSTWLFPLVYAAPVRHTPGNYKEDPLGLAPKCLLGVFNPRHMDFMRHWKPLDRPPGVIKKKKFLPRKPWTFQLILFDIIPHWTYSVKPSQSKFFKILQTCLTALTLTTLLALSQIANLR